MNGWMDKEITGRSKVPLGAGQSAKVPAPGPGTCFHSPCALRGQPSRGGWVVSVAGVRERKGG